MQITIFQLIVKYTDQRSFKSLNELTVEIGDIYTENENVARFHEIFVQYSRYTEIIVKSVLYALTTYAITYIALSILYSIITGKMMPTLGFYMPGVDENTTWGITVLVLQQIVASILGIIAEMAYDATLYAVFLNMAMISAVIVAHIDEFQKSLSITGGASRVDVRRKQIGLIRMHLKYNEWVTVFVL